MAAKASVPRIPILTGPARACILEVEVRGAVDSSDFRFGPTGSGHKGPPEHGPENRQGGEHSEGPHAWAATGWLADWLKPQTPARS